MERFPKEPRLRGAEMFFITPILLGGSPTAKENVTLLTREQHIQAVRYWNKIISDLGNEQQPIVATQVRRKLEKKAYTQEFGVQKIGIIATS